MKLVCEQRVVSSLGLNAMTVYLFSFNKTFKLMKPFSAARPVDYLADRMLFSDSHLRLCGSGTLMVDCL